MHYIVLFLSYLHDYRYIINQKKFESYYEPLLAILYNVHRNLRLHFIL